MDKEIKTLYATPFVELRELKSKEAQVNGYSYLHETRCNGNIVAILPYRYSSDFNKIEFLLRNEFTPPWSLNKLFLSSITGGVDNDETISNNGKKDLEVNVLNTVVRELEEETGFRVSLDDDKEISRITFLGRCNGTKSCDTVYHLYAVDVHELEEHQPLGDGTFEEQKAYNEWFLEDDPTIFEKARDPFVYVLISKFYQVYE